MKNALRSLGFMVCGLITCVWQSAASFAEAPQTGTFRGTIRFQGEVPVFPPLVKQGAKIKTTQTIIAEAIPDQSLVVNSENKGIANVFVYLLKAPEADSDVVAPEQTEMTCRKYQLEPHALFVQTGQLIHVTNQDPAPENIKVNSIRNPMINTVVKANDQEGFTYDYRRAEVQPVRITSDFHPWVSAWHLVLNHPFAAVTDQDGKFEIKGLPPGSYKFLIWQEKAGLLERALEVTIKPGVTAEKNIGFHKTRFIKQTSQTGTFSGKVVLKDEIPMLPPLVKANDPDVKDTSVCAASTIPDESLAVASKSRGIANVFVYLRKRPETIPTENAEESKTPLILGVEGCRFVPHAMVIRTTDRVKLDFKDDVAHIAHAHPLKSHVAGALIPPNPQKNEIFLQEFDQAEPIPVKIGCDIHCWMEAYVLPLDHPFAAITDANGIFEIDGLPEGLYEFWFWQERAGWLEKQYKINIKAGTVTAANLSYTADRFKE